MDFKTFYLLEKKDHLIRKLVNLTDEQKNEVIEFFKTHNTLEGKIDWNNKNLTYDDFKSIMSDRSKTQIKKAVKTSGIKGLKEGEDYKEIPLNSDKVQAYIPLTYEASKLIASDYIGGCEGKWCTAYQKTSDYWRSYTIDKQIVLVYFILENNKFALAIYPDNKTIEVFDKDDQNIYDTVLWSLLELRGIKNAKNKIMSQEQLNEFDDVREIIKENIPIGELTKEQIYQLAKDLLSSISRDFDDNEQAFHEAKIIIEQEYDRLSDFIEETHMSSDQIKAHIEDQFSAWESGYINILDYMKANHSIDRKNIQNKINALSNCVWASEESVDRSTELQERLLELKWKTIFDEDYEDMMTRWINEKRIYKFNDIPEKELIKWLSYQYKNNYDEFIKCKENFVDDFDKGTYQTEGYKLDTSLSDEEKEYLNNLIAKVESKMYSKEKSQTKLKLK